MLARKLIHHVVEFGIAGAGRIVAGLKQTRFRRV
jgi:hypothetical protein